MWSRGYKAQGLQHTKKSLAKDRLSEDRPFRSQRQGCSRPKTQRASVEKKGFRAKKSQIFREIPAEEKKDHELAHFLTNQRVVLSEDSIFEDL